ncbi:MULTISPECIES: hypothetical protein [Prauserella salsuginis group]|uniref:Uncharacterized protein n=2 Tax=Prauserella salsuginis group TaxID=2893672 RepID=A0A839XIB8_9PSEU|nr:MULTISPECIES: hypothetical protein [Prauserella salsuginis group]MBB3663020.1 hypothetical protein [Prauserella sediminis]MCR3721250.1 hypothetical protein [Prauserella flava]MCR3734669.1 hypothetical protein [Prauserella salsuginis]
MTCSSELAPSEVEAALGRLISKGYRFVHPRDTNGDLVTVVGVRMHEAVVDVVRLDAEDDVTATRMPYDEPNILEPKQVLWQRNGDMDRVVDELLELADDQFAEPIAPVRTGKGCWVPNGSGRAKWLQATA